MTFLVIYVAIGIVAYIWLFKTTHKDVMPACSLLFGSEVGLFICAALWPVMIPFSLIDNSIQEQELKEKENRKEPEKIDLSFLIGEVGETTTPQSPSGKALVQGTEYETRSMLAFIPKGTKIRVVGHSMHHLQIEPADPDAVGNG